MPIEVSCSIMSTNSWNISVTSDFDTLEIRAIATDSRLISSWLMCLMTSAATSSPIDNMTTADFSTSVSPGLLKAASVTGYPSPDNLSRPCRIVGDQRLHGFGLDPENVLRPAHRQRRHAPPGARLAWRGRRIPGWRNIHVCRDYLEAAQPTQQREHSAEQRQEARYGQERVLADRRYPRFFPPRRGSIGIARGHRLERQVDHGHLRVLPCADRGRDELVDRLQPFRRDRAAARIVDEHRDIDAAQLPGRVFEELHRLVDVIIGRLVAIAGQRSGGCGGRLSRRCRLSRRGVRLGGRGRSRGRVDARVVGAPVRQGAWDADRLIAFRAAGVDGLVLAEHMAFAIFDEALLAL